MTYRNHVLAIACVLCFSAEAALAQWTSANGEFGGMVNTIAASGDTIYVGTSDDYVWSEVGMTGKTYRTTDNGSHWVDVSAGLSGGPVISLAVMGSIVITPCANGSSSAPDSGLYRSTDAGDHWNRVVSTGGDGIFHSLLVTGSTLYAASDSGVVRSLDSGASWIRTGSATKFSFLAGPENDLYAVTLVQGGIQNTGNLCHSIDSGATWSKVAPANSGISVLAVSDTTVFVGLKYLGVFRSTDNGATWGEVDTGLTRLPPTGNIFVTALTALGSDLYAGLHNGGVFCSTDNGMSWRSANSGFGNQRVVTLSVSGDNIFAGTYYGGVFRKSRNDTIWIPLKGVGLQKGNITTLVSSGTRLIAGGSGGFWSADSGTSWNVCNNGLLNGNILSAAALRDTQFVGTNYDLYDPSGLYRSTNQGASWDLIVPHDGIRSLVFIGSDLFAASEGSGVIRSSDRGVSWSVVYPSLQANALDTFSGKLFAATYSGIYRRAVDDTGWTKVCDYPSQSLATSETSIFAASYGGILQSSGFGDVWAAISDSSRPMAGARWIAVRGADLFAGTEGFGVFHTSDNGATWQAITQGLPPTYLASTYINSIRIQGSSLFVSVVNGGVWRRPLSDFVTGVNAPSSTDLPREFRLEQNFPNPFNPSTNIGYTIASSKEQVAGSAKQVGMERVRLAVYDLLGREVAVLVDGYQTPGEHRVTFDARMLASGVYFYRLAAGGQSLSRKLVLLK